MSNGNPLPHPEQLRQAAGLAFDESANGQPQQLGELWLSVEELKSRAKAAKEVADKMSMNAKAALLEADEIEQAIIDVAKAKGIEKANAGYGLLKFKLAGGKQAVAITGIVPPEFMRKKTVEEVNKTLINEKLMAGDILDFACLEERSLKVTLEPI